MPIRMKYDGVCRMIRVVLLLTLLTSAFSAGNFSANAIGGLNVLSTDLGLDEDASSWGVYTEVQNPGTPAPAWELNNLLAPSLDGRALHCAITGGAKYSNVHCYRNLPSDPTSNTFMMSLSFYYRPLPASVQALEFTMNKWQDGLRYEWAVQWDNLGPGGPRWRYWDPNQPHPNEWVDLGIIGSLTEKSWHTLQLEGEIASGQVHYRRFMMDGQIHSLDISVAPASAPSEPDKLAVAIQLDGNDSNNTGVLSPYEIFLDKVTFAHVLDGIPVDSFVDNTLRSTSLLSAGQSTRQSYEGLNNGPVKLMSTNGVGIIGAERVVYKVNGINTSFSEMMGLPSNQVDKTYWLPWYNNLDLDTQLRFANVSNSTATVRVLIGGQEMSGSPFTLTAGASTRMSFTTNNGPVKITSNVNIVAAERVIYKANSTNTSFSEMMALPNSQLNTTYWLPWYNNLDLDTQLRFANTSTTQQATVHIFIGGHEMPGSPFTLAAGASTRQSFAVNNGPVQITSNINIVAAERVIYKVSGIPTSFTELMALPNSQLNTIYWLPWYNNSDLDTQLRIGNVSGDPATIHIFVGEREVTPVSGISLASGASTRLSYAGVNNGPVKIQSDQNIVAAERVIYRVNNIPTSFSEMMGLPNGQLNTTYWLPWYNNVDLDTQLRFGIP